MFMKTFETFKQILNLFSQKKDPFSFHYWVREARVWEARPCGNQPSQKDRITKSSDQLWGPRSVERARAKCSPLMNKERREDYIERMRKELFNLPKVRIRKDVLERQWLRDICGRAFNSPVTSMIRKFDKEVIPRGYDFSFSKRMTQTHWQSF